jgi:hypothetical protein
MGFTCVVDWIGLGLRRLWIGLSLVGVVPIPWVRMGSSEWFASVRSTPSLLRTTLRRCCFMSMLPPPPLCTLIDAAAAAPLPYCKISGSRRSPRCVCFYLPPSPSPSSSIFLNHAWKQMKSWIPVLGHLYHALFVGAAHGSRKEEERGGSQLWSGFYWKNEQIGSLMFSGWLSDLCLDFSSPWCGRFLTSFDGTLHAGASLPSTISCSDYLASETRELVLPITVWLQRLKWWHSSGVHVIHVCFYGVTNCF